MVNRSDACNAELTTILESNAVRHYFKNAIKLWSKTKTQLAKTSLNKWINISDAIFMRRKDPSIPPASWPYPSWSDTILWYSLLRCCASKNWYGAMRPKTYDMCNEEVVSWSKAQPDLLLRKRSLREVLQESDIRHSVRIKHCLDQFALKLHYDILPAA
jgi:hypothetical protein